MPMDIYIQNPTEINIQGTVKITPISATVRVKRLVMKNNQGSCTNTAKLLRKAVNILGFFCSNKNGNVKVCRKNQNTNKTTFPARINKLIV